MRRLLYCPICKRCGINNVLGEVVDEGFLIKRFHKGETLIKSDEFIVVCGNCKEPIYFRRRPTMILKRKEEYYFKRLNATIK